MSISNFLLLLSALTLLAGCARDPSRPAVIGDGYVGPMVLNVHEELAPRAKVVATVNHGDRIEILQLRRRFARVRTPEGAEGWLDTRLLLTADELDSLRRRAEHHAESPSMGNATVHDALNIHTEPHRQAPSFDQIPAKGMVHVLAHRVEERVPYNPPSVIPPKPAAVPTKKRARQTDKLETPPMPAAPEPPENWVELSNRDVNEEMEPEPKVEEVRKPERSAPVRLDDWSLVRTKQGNVGWVLTRALIMAIPDEVAQYAEGHRITSYFSLGSVTAEGREKHHWLWTTISKNNMPYEFDGFRVFIYNTRRNRYETSYIQRNVKGYYPIEAFPAGRRGGAVSPEFSLVLEDKEGRTYKQTYAFEGYRVRMVSKEPWTRPAEPGSNPELVNVASAPQPEKSVFGKIKQKIFGR